MISNDVPSMIPQVPALSAVARAVHALSPARLPRYGVLASIALATACGGGSDAPVEECTPTTATSMVAGSTGRERPTAAATTGALPSTMLDILAAMPEGSWRKANLNAFSDVWTPDGLRPYVQYPRNPTPRSILEAWSSFAWDSNRAQLVLYGGGHANYAGNDVYTWSAVTGQWQRASLPTYMIRDGLNNVNAVDGVANAPASAHTYDNTMFFPGLDRVVVLGGAADSNGGYYLTQDTATESRVTGPYLFDPSRADGNKVGGTTGSHVQREGPHPEIVGGQMWSNREAWLNADPNSPPPHRYESFVNGCSAEAVKGGKDVGYVRTMYRLFRYTIHDLATPAADTWELVGRYFTTGSGDMATCALDPARGIFLVAGNYAVHPFVYWDINAPPGIDNHEVSIMPADPTGDLATLLASSTHGNPIGEKCAVDFDRPRSQFKLWCGDGRVWSINPPANLGAAGWTMVKAPTAPVGAVPDGQVGTGILGKWKYAPNLDAFVGIGSPDGDVWIYKPVGWVDPRPAANQLPQVVLSQPALGQAFLVGDTVQLAATASDSDGAVVKVEYFANGAKVGESGAAPHRLNWTPAAAGNWVLSARATDNDGGQTLSPTVAVTVNPPATPANQPPAIALTDPAPGASVTQGVPITIAANAADADGSVTRVEFYAGAAKIGEVTQAPFAISWTGAAVGDHAIRAQAYDNSGASTSSAPRSITVVAVTPPAPANTAPTVALSAPGDGASVPTGGVVTIEAAAGDPDGSVVRVEFYVAGVKIGEDTQAPFSLAWTDAPVGSHRLTAMAFDNQGASTTSQARTIEITSSGGAPTCNVKR